MQVSDVTAFRVVLEKALQGDDLEDNIRDLCLPTLEWIATLEFMLLYADGGRSLDIPPSPSRHLPPENPSAEFTAPAGRETKRLTEEIHRALGIMRPVAELLGIEMLHPETIDELGPHYLLPLLHDIAAHIHRHTIDIPDDPDLENDDDILVECSKLLDQVQDINLVREFLENEMLTR